MTVSGCLSMCLWGGRAACHARLRGLFLLYDVLCRQVNLLSLPLAFMLKPLMPPILDLVVGSAS